MRAVLAMLLCGMITGCANPNTKPTELKFGSSDTIITSGAIRMVSERPRPLPGDGTLPTVCTEPSPDVAIAFARSAAVSGSFSEPQGPTASASGSFSTSETITPLAGRTAGVLALRDGLFAACQSYVNGVIGHDAYALILSQYGNLLVALNGTGTVNQATFTAQDAADSAVCTENPIRAC
jgi:hypothetical protein